MKKCETCDKEAMDADRFCGKCKLEQPDPAKDLGVAAGVEPPSVYHCINCHKLDDAAIQLVGPDEVFGSVCTTCLKGVAQGKIVFNMVGPDSYRVEAFNTIKTSA